MPTRTAAVAVLAVLVALLTAGGPAAAAGGGPRVSVGSTLVWPALPVTVTGSGYRPGGGRVTVRLAGTVLGSAPVRATGRFTFTGKVPSTARQGPAQVSAAQGARSASTGLRVRVQWTQFGLFAAHRNDAFYEHRLSPSTIREAKPIYQNHLMDVTPSRSGMILAQGVLIYGTNTGAIGIEAATGKLLWTYDTGGTGGLTGPVYDPVSGQVYVAYGSEILTLNPLTGQETKPWLDVPGGPLNGRLSLDKGLLFETTATRGGTAVIAIDPVARTVRWQAQLTDPLGGGAQVLLNGTVYDSGHNLMAVDEATGKLKWSVPLSDDPNLEGGIAAASPAGLIIGMSDKTTRSYDPDTGRQLWSTPPLHPEDGARAGTVAVTADRVFVDYGSATFALRADNGDVIWERPGGGAQLVYANGLLFGWTNRDEHETEWRMTVTNAQTGDTITSYPTVGPADVGVVIADGTVYIPIAGVEAVALPPAPAPTGP